MHALEFADLVLFLSTLSLRRATESIGTLRTVSVNFYPRSPCGERRRSRCLKSRRIVISIHALLAESDRRPIFFERAGYKFLSTLSLRRATVVCGCPRVDFGHFYPRSPCGERPNRLSRQSRLPAFLSTLSLRRATIPFDFPSSHLVRFLSTLSLRRATNFKKSVSVTVPFLSTLSLRRATSPCCGWFEVVNYFYPRSPCGERRLFFGRDASKSRYFYPRSPCGERHHARPTANTEATNFYPRSPCGERRTLTCSAGCVCSFLSTLSLRRATAALC